MRSVATFLERFGVHHPTFAVCVCQFGSTMLHTTFMFYYVKVFLNVYGVNQRWFDSAQILFLVWNALNDPLFGYLQNKSGSWMRNRRKVILYGSPFFAASFLLPWFPWYSAEKSDWIVGVHLIVSLYVYDGLFSFVLLAWCSLFAEITTDHAGRVRAVKYMQIACLFGVNVLTVMDRASKSLSDLHSFQICSVFVALIAFCCFYYTGRFSRDCVAQCENAICHSEISPDEFSFTPVSNGFVEVHKTNEIRASKQPFLSANSESNWKISVQVFRNADFQRFVWMNFLCVCRSTMHMNFAAIFTEHLIPQTYLPLGSWRIGCFYGFGAVFPQILVISCSSFANKYGSYKLMVFSFALSLVSGLVMYCVGIDYPLCIMIFMIVDSVAVHSFTPLTNILCADLIDADMANYKRSIPVSSILFGLNALVCKPGISLAPMAVVYFLESSGYESVKDSKTSTVDPSVEEEVKKVMFNILCFGPVLLGALQYLVFRNYSLRSTHLRR